MAINVKDKLVTLESLGVAYSAEQDAREEADQALSTRIDNIVAPDGDPSLTEVSDARVSGSTTHNTLKARLDADKTAIETEISQLSADLEDLDDRVEALESGSGGSGLTSDIKQALLACFEHVIFTDNVDDYYGNLYSALYETTWSITNILNECISNNAAASVNKGASYTATLTPKEFYEITAVRVIMGGVDVTNIVYNAGVINIPSVTGAVVINATATLSIPSGYTALNYILTTGAEYAESGVYESAILLSCEVKIRRTSYSTTTPNAHILSANNSYYSYLGTTGSAKYIKTKFNGAAASENAFEWELNTDYVIVTNIGNLSVTIDGTSVGSFVVGNTYDASNQYTIATYGGNATQTKYRFVGRIYYIKLYDSSGTVHYFQPALRTNDNVAGFYDLATDTFITSATATAFTGA